MTTCRSMRGGRLAAFACALGCLWFAAPARATLGEPAPVIANATTRTLAGGAARVLTYIDEDGTTINAYVDATNNVVFAYSWQGPAMPNLRALLGRHEASFRSGAADARSARHVGLHAARVDRSDVVVETGGHMRGYIGRAWLPGALPQGVSEGDLR